MPRADACPCGGGLTYADCCGPLHEGQVRAATAEQLMRARYSAYARRRPEYVLATWHPSTRPASLELDGSLSWTGLTVVAVRDGGVLDRTGTVQFRASWQGPAGTGVMSETSRFVRTADGWLYVDGD